MSISFRRRPTADARHVFPSSQVRGSLVSARSRVGSFYEWDPLDFGCETEQHDITIHKSTTIYVDSLFQQHCHLNDYIPLDIYM